MIRFVLFDLDGTLTDSQEGITRSVQYALEQAGITEKDLSKLKPFIGPPLKDSFQEFYGMNEEQTLRAIKDYRVRFEKKGWKENKVYPGIHNLLRELKKKGCILAVASSKPEVYVEKILKYFRLRSFFHVVVGAELDGTRGKKEEVVACALDQLYEGYGQGKSREDCIASTAMVGDRKFDMEGAVHFGLEAIGVSYGFAPPGELEAAGADAIAGSAEELKELLLGGEDPEIYEEKQRQKEKEEEYFRAQDLAAQSVPAGGFDRAIYMLFPLLVYMLLNMLGSIVSGYILRLGGYVGEGGETSAGNMEIVLGIRLVMTVVIALIMYLIYRKRELMPQLLPLNRPASYIRLGCCLVLGITMALALNILTSVLASFLPASIQQVVYDASYAGGMSFWPGLLMYGFLIPMEEEIIYRWLLLGRIRRVFSRALAIALAAFIFGVQHGNPAQGIYAFLMGLLMGFLFTDMESILSSYIFHVGANSIIYLAYFLPESTRMQLGSLPFGLLFLAVAAVFFALYLRRLRPARH